MLDKLKNLTVRERVGLFAAGLSLFAVVMNYGVAGPIARYINRAESEVRLEQENMKVARSVADLEQSVAGRYENTKGLLETAVSPSEAIDDMKGQIDDLAKRSGVSVNAMDHREPVSGPAMDTYLVDIGQFESDMKGLLQFLHEIRTAPGLLRVEKLIFSTDKEKGVLKGSVLISKTMVREPGSENKPVGETPAESEPQ